MATLIGSLDAKLNDVEVRSELDLLKSDGTIASLGHASCTLIQTTNNSYLFLMTGVAEQRGLLVGGPLGDSPTRAVLVGATPYSRDASTYPSCLRRGSRVIFVIETDGIWKRMITSEIVRVVHSQVESHYRPPAACH